MKFQRFSKLVVGLVASAEPKKIQVGRTPTAARVFLTVVDKP